MMDQTLVESGSETRPAGFIRLMGNRNYALLWWGQLISELGNRFHWVAVSLWIYAATGSAAAVSIAISSMFVGGLLVGLWAGVLVDRLNRKAIMIAADIVRAGLVALIPFLMDVHVWLVYANLILVSVATAFFRPAIFAVVPQVVRRRDLMPANSFFAAMDTGTEIAGPMLAGILAFRYGYAVLLYVDAVSYAISALFILAMSLPALVTKATQALNIRNVWAGVVEGFNYIRRDTLQWSLFILLFPTALVGSGLNALQTPLAKGVVRITDAEFGTFQSVWGIGFVIASMLLGWFGPGISRSMLILGGYLLAFVATALMGLSASFEALLVTGFGVGFANTLYYVSITTTIMERSPGEVLGRVLGTRQVAISFVRVAAPLVFGAAADMIGVRQSILLMALLGVLGTVTITARMPIVFQLSASQRPLLASLPPVWQALIVPTNPEFDTAQQRRLNVIAIGIAASAAIGFSYMSPFYGLGLLITIISLISLGAAARRKGWLP